MTLAELVSPNIGWCLLLRFVVHFPRSFAVNCCSLHCELMELINRNENLSFPQLIYNNWELLLGRGRRQCQKQFHYYRHFIGGRIKTFIYKLINQRELCRRTRYSRCRNINLMWKCKKIILDKNSSIFLSCNLPLLIKEETITYTVRCWSTWHGQVQLGKIHFLLPHSTTVPELTLFY